MKNVLFATSALVALGGAALADAHSGISLNGSARLGLIYQEDGVGATGDEIAGTSRVRLGVTASGTSDSGLTFGASARLDQGDASDQSDNQGGDDTAQDDNGRVSTNGSVFVSGSFGTLSYQDVDDAVENRVSNVDAISLTAFGDRHEIARSGVAGSIIRYDYDAGAFGVSLSSNGALEDYQVGLSYSSDMFTAGIGYDDAVDGGHVAASLGVSFGDLALKVAASDNDDDTDTAVSVSYSAGALGLAVWANDNENSVDGDETFYGVGASYDLGGGLSVVGGVSTGDDSQTVADFGLNMSF